MKTAVLVFALVVLQFAAHTEAHAGVANVLTVHSQNGRFYLHSIPFDTASPTTRGVTRVYAIGQSAPLYELERGFDEVTSDSNNLILSDDGETIFYFIPWAADEKREGMKSVTLYRHGHILRSYTAAEIDGCDKRRESCNLKYYAQVIDREKSWAGESYKRVFNDGVPEEEKFLSDFAIFSNGDTVYLTDSNKRTHLFDLKDGVFVRSASFDDLYATMKVLARFSKVELERIEANWYGDFPRLKSGGNTSKELARYLDIKEVDWESPVDPGQYKIYRVTVSSSLLRDGSLEIEDIEVEEGLPRDRVVEFFKINRFEVGNLPAVFEKFRIGALDEGEIFYFRKSDKRLARRERQKELEQENRLELGASAVLHEDRLVHLDETGHVRVWRLGDGSFDATATAKFSRKDLVRLASDGRQFWALGASKIFRWSSQEGSWRSAANFNLKRNPVKGFAVAGGVPLLVLEAGIVMNPVTTRTYTTNEEHEFELMKMDSELEIGPDVDGSQRKTYPERYMPFRLFGRSLSYTIAVLGTESRLWIGISRGEWGGALYGLNPANGTWVDHGELTGYVTGMTQDESGELIVSWSMSHMGDAGTTLRRHRPDAEPSLEIPDPGSKYYQTVAFNPFDNTLYGVEQGDVVAVSDGKHTKIAELDGPVYGRERMAVGVAPGIGSLLPFAPGALIVVPKQGMPWLLRDGKLMRLTAP